MYESVKWVYDAINATITEEAFKELTGSSKIMLACRTDSSDRCRDVRRLGALDAKRIATANPQFWISAKGGRRESVAALFL